MTNLKAAAQGHPRCIFNVSPKELPVFNRPYSSFQDFLLGVQPSWSDSDMIADAGNGVDLAYNTSYAWSDLGGGIGSTSFIDHALHSSSTHGNSLDHAGHDWGFFQSPGVPHATWKVRAVGAGRVILARQRASGEACQGQRDVIVHHRVGSSLTTPYREEFYSYYSHMDDFDVSVGDDVVAFQSIGEVGTSGCMSAPIDHLHFGVFRVRNVSGQLMDLPPLIPHDAQTERRMIDPFGWNSGASVDPWAFLAPPGFGAASIDLWKGAYRAPDWPYHGAH